MELLKFSQIIKLKDFEFKKDDVLSKEKHLYLEARFTFLNSLLTGIFHFG